MVILMGGPGVAAISCAQHISDAADMMRTLRSESSGNVELKSSIVDVMHELAEAKLAALEAFDEIQRSSAYGRMRDEELGYVHQLRTAETQRQASIEIDRAPIAPLAAVPPKPESPNESQQAAQLIRLVTFAAADQGFQSLDTFASWFVGGTAAAVGLMIANFEKVEPYVGGLDLQATLSKVVIALGLVGVAKFFGSLVCTMALGADRGLEVLDAWQKRGLPIPSAASFETARGAALPAPFR